MSFIFLHWKYAEVDPPLENKRENLFGNLVKKKRVPESQVWFLPILEIKNSNAVLWFLQKISVKKGFLEIKNSNAVLWFLQKISVKKGFLYLTYQSPL